MTSFLPAAAPIPARAGIGLRSSHHREVVGERPHAAWLEVHSENFIAAGGPQLALLERVRDEYPLSLHGVGLSLGSTDPIDRAHLAKLRRLADRFEPQLVSEHLSWSSFGGQFVNDLLPFPYTYEALQHVAGRVLHVQDVLRRPVLIENPSSYLSFACSEMHEWEFPTALCARTGCSILLDVNNVYVSAHNLGFDPIAYIDGVAAAPVAEFHLAGHSRVQRADGRDVLIDTHDARVCDEVWKLFSQAVGRIGPRPTLIEWDANLPSFDVLQDEARIADSHLEQRDVLAA